MSTNRTLYIWFNDACLPVHLYHNPVADLIYKKFKHLANLPIQLFDGDVFFNKQVVDFDHARERLIDHAQALGIEIKSASLEDQSYLNYLHGLYEENFNGQELWLRFHEHIHIIEKIINNRIQPILSVDYRTRAGKLEEKFDRSFLQYSTARVKKNQCFIQWQELAKTPYQYFVNKEPNDISRLCQLVKPWLTIRPSLHFACDEINFLDNVDLAAFDNWFSDYQEQWCKFWNLSAWNNIEPWQVIPIGEIDSADLFVEKLKNNQLPLRITQ